MTLVNDRYTFRLAIARYAVLFIDDEFVDTHLIDRLITHEPAAPSLVKLKSLLSQIQSPNETDAKTIRSLLVTAANEISLLPADIEDRCTAWKIISYHYSTTAPTTYLSLKNHVWNWNDESIIAPSGANKPDWLYEAERQFNSRELRTRSEMRQHAQTTRSRIDKFADSFPDLIKGPA